MRCRKFYSSLCIQIKSPALTHSKSAMYRAFKKMYGQQIMVFIHISCVQMKTWAE
jgi:hypothetical protein